MRFSAHIESRLQDAGDNSTQAEIRRVYKKTVVGADYPLPPNFRKHKTPEAEITRDAKAILSKHGGWFRRIEASGVYRSSVGKMTPSQMIGIPDIIWLHPFFGFWGIELKRGKGKISTTQMANLKAIQNSGGTAVVVCTLGGMQRAIKDWHPIVGLIPDKNLGIPIY
jgi:hypothetical protein